MTLRLECGRALARFRQVSTRHLVPFVILAGLAAPSSARAGGAPGTLVMDGHDRGHIVYADRCSNGASSDQAGFDRFVAALRADPKSRLARTLARAEARFVTDKQFYEVALGDWIPTYHLRDGCAGESISYSAFVFVRAKQGNSHELWTKYLVTIDDDVDADRRTFRIRSIVPLALREQ